MSSPDTIGRESRLASKCDRQKKFFRPSRLSIATALLFIVPPWILVAVPGEDLGKGTFGSCTIRHHGWPLTHQQSAKIRFTNKQRAFYSSSPDWDSSNLAGQQLENCIKKRPGAYESAGDQYLRQIKDQRIFPNVSRFWTDVRNWPISESTDGWAWKIKWGGMIGNLAIIAAVIWLIAMLIDRRIRRRRNWLSFSLFEFVIVLTVVGVAIAVITSEYHRATREHQLVGTLLGSSRSGRIERKTPFLPRVLFNLFDHRASLPRSSIPLFAPVESFFASPGSLDPKDLAECDFPVGWDLGKISMDDVRFLQSIDRTTTEQLAFEMRPVFKVYGVYDNMLKNNLVKTNPLAYWEQFLPIPNDFPNLKVLQVGLTGGDQRAQLERLAQIDSFGKLELLILFDVDDRGKEWLELNDDKLPSEVRQEFSYPGQSITLPRIR